MLAKIPLNKAIYSLFVYGKVVGKYFDNSFGTLLKLEDKSFGVAFYSFSRYRRAYIFCDANIDTKNIPLYEGYLPLIKEKIKVIYFAEHRKVDLLKFACRNLDILYGEDIYTYDIKYWLRFASLIDSYGIRKGMTGKTRRNITLLTERYKKERKRLNENL